MKIQEATQIVMRDCLQVQRRDNVLVYFDQVGQPIAEAFLEAARSLPECDLLARFVPIKEQAWHAGNDRNPQTIRVDIAKSDVLVTVVSDSDKCTRFRVNIVNLAVANSLRILHMPGVNENTFIRAVDGVDFQALHARGADLVKRFSEGQAVTIKTRTASGDSCILSASIRGRKAHICGGIAEPGEIMNLPTGEVYIAPVEALTTGELVLNGSTDRAVFHDGEEVVLRFDKGTLDLERSSFPERATSAALRTQLEKARARDSNNMILCEIGIGLNPAARRLSGSEIWDEKAAGTAHVALGANTPFGGTISGDYHRDLVFYPEAILVDDETVDVRFGRNEEAGK